MDNLVLITHKEFESLKDGDELKFDFEDGDNIPKNVFITTESEKAFFPAKLQGTPQYASGKSWTTYQITHPETPYHD